MAAATHPEGPAYGASVLQGDRVVSKDGLGARLHHHPGLRVRSQRQLLRDRVPDWRVERGPHRKPARGGREDHTALDADSHRNRPAFWPSGLATSWDGTVFVSNCSIAPLNQLRALSGQAVKSPRSPADAAPPNHRGWHAGPRPPRGRGRLPSPQRPGPLGLMPVENVARLNLASATPVKVRVDRRWTEGPSTGPPSSAWGAPSTRRGLPIRLLFDMAERSLSDFAWQNATAEGPL